MISIREHSGFQQEDQQCTFRITEDILAMARPQPVHFENDDIIRLLIALVYRFFWSRSYTENI